MICCGDCPHYRMINWSGYLAGFTEGYCEFDNEKKHMLDERQCCRIKGGPDGINGVRVFITMRKPCTMCLVENDRTVMPWMMGDKYRNKKTNQIDVTCRFCRQHYTYPNDLDTSIAEWNKEQDNMMNVIEKRLNDYKELILSDPSKRLVGRN